MTAPWIGWKDWTCSSGLGNWQSGAISIEPARHLRDTDKKASRPVRILGYIKTFGLQHIDLLDLEKYLATVFIEKRLGIVQTVRSRWHPPFPPLHLPDVFID